MGERVNYKSKVGAMIELSLIIGLIMLVVVATIVNGSIRALWNDIAAIYELFEERERGDRSRGAGGKFES